MSEKMAARDLSSRMRQFEMEAKLKSGHRISSEVDDHIDADNRRKNVQLNRKLKAFDQECKVNVNLIEREIQSVKRFQQQIISQRKSTSTPPEGERLRKSSHNSGMKLPPITERQKILLPVAGRPEEGLKGLDSARNDGEDSERPSARSSISWTPGVNEASAKRIRERVMQSLDQERKQSRSHSLGEHFRPSLDSLLHSSSSTSPSKNIETHLELSSDSRPRRQRASTGSVPYPSSNLSKKTPSSTDVTTNASANASTYVSANASNTSLPSPPMSIRERAKERVRKRAVTITRMQNSVDNQFVQSQPLDHFSHQPSADTSANSSPPPNISSTQSRRLRAATIDSLPTPRKRSSTLDSIDKMPTSRSRAATDVEQLSGPRSLASTLNEGDRSQSLQRKLTRESSTSSSSGSLEKGWSSQEKLVLFPTAGAKMPTGKPIIHHKSLAASLDRLAVEH